MAPFIESGHARNLANLRHLIDACTGYGSAYAPAKAALSLTQLNATHTAAKNQLAEILVRKTAYSDAINARYAAFADIRTRATRLINALRASDASPQKISDAIEYNRKIQGSRVSKPKENLDPNAPVPKTISTSQQSYDQLVQHLTGLIEVLSSEPSYSPNEADLKLVNLKSYRDDLQVKINNIGITYTAVSNARIQRDKLFYTAPDSAYSHFYDVKAYIRSVFGISSPEYQQISALAFKKLKR